MKAKIEKLKAFILSSFAGRYECREMGELLKKIDDGVDVTTNLEKLKVCLEKFQCTSQLEISQRTEALTQLSEIIKTISNVQSSETPDNDPGTENPGDTEAQDAAGVANDETEKAVTEPAPEASVKNEVTDSEQATETTDESTPGIPNPEPEAETPTETEEPVPSEFAGVGETPAPAEEPTKKSKKK